MDKYIGRLLDNRYEILEVLGTGGMAVVYKARCHRLNRLVAIKILKDDYSQDEEFRRRFHAESQAVAMLSHPNIVSVYDVSTSGGADFIVMELIDGITLKQYMERKGVLNWKETLHFAIQIGKALDHAHSRGIVHRDIKPHNVMVLKNGSVKVTDFGIARVMSESNTLTKEALGSVHYISPEQAKGGRVDSRSDIYSLGVVMYEMMTGRPPYDGESPVAVAIQHINGKAAMPSTLNPNIPGGLEQIIMKAMAPSTAKRYATTSAMLYDMDEFRKNPAILFDYNNPHTDIDAGVKLAEQHQKEAAKPAVKPAPERPAVKQAPPKPRPEPAKQKPRRQRVEEVIEEDEERGSKIATAAVVICALVALVAIGIFVYAFMNGGLGTQHEVIEVPNLIGMTQKEITAQDVVIKVGDKKHNDQYAKDQIYDQNPKPGTKISKGQIVTIYISLGTPPAEKTMEQLIDLEEENAKKFLVDGLGIDANKIIVHQETHATIAPGRVTRTEPVEGEKIEDGQVVTIWISIGPEVRMEMVPNVLGRDVEKAESLLNVNGFYNISLEHVESNKAKGTVIHQSVAPQTEIDVTTEIILEVSLGPSETQPPTTVPTEPTFPPVDPELVTKVITVGLPEEMVETYKLSIWSDGVLLEEREIPVGTISTEFEVSGKGVMEFELRINDANPWTVEVDFDE